MTASDEPVSSTSRGIPVTNTALENCTVMFRTCPNPYEPFGAGEVTFTTAGGGGVTI